ncbi:hypothetical protein C0991_004738 [Blastosporella zonata]|nr:hypothetical protein C0991_004738 [Blastosporella zonata]
MSSVPLPSREQNNPTNAAPVWPITSSTTGVEVPLTANCGQPNRQDGICCKELKADERTLIDPDVVRDVVIGLSDGLTVPFALTAGLSSLGESRLVVLGGVAELIAGAISMGIGGFLASQSERDHYRYLRNQTAARVVRSCDGEMEREVADVLVPVGVDEKTCRSVAQCLREVEMQAHESGHPSDEETALRWSGDVGITAFLLKFGLGMAFTIGMGYLVGGLIPLLPYFFIPRAHIALIYSSIVTGIVLLVFGAVKSHVTGAGVGAKSYVYGAVSTLLVGGIAAGAAFGIVKLLEG